MSSSTRNITNLTGNSILLTSFCSVEVYSNGSSAYNDLIETHQKLSMFLKIYSIMSFLVNRDSFQISPFCLLNNFIFQISLSLFEKYMAQRASTQWQACEYRTLLLLSCVILFDIIKVRVSFCSGYTFAEVIFQTYKLNQCILDKYKL